jgi:bifunctional DNA-binding transcriptional regulator/antitoxin component of YhaV-PrlF toxin-antitoxin module
VNAPSTVLRIWKDGRLTIPAVVRRRWGAAEVLFEDRGDSVVIRPILIRPIREKVTERGRQAGEPSPSDDRSAR